MSARRTCRPAGSLVCLAPPLGFGVPARLLLFAARLLTYARAGGRCPRDSVPQLLRVGPKPIRGVQLRARAVRIIAAHELARAHEVLVGLFLPRRSRRSFLLLGLALPRNRRGSHSEGRFHLTDLRTEAFRAAHLRLGFVDLVRRRQTLRLDTGARCPEHSPLRKIELTDLTESGDLDLGGIGRLRPAEQPLESRPGELKLSVPVRLSERRGLRQ